MSLDKGKLYHGLLRWFRVPGGVGTHREAEQRFARVYHSYAQDAEDVSGERPNNLDAEKFERLLAFQRSRVGKDFVRQIDSSFVAYWTGTTFPILVVPPASPPCPNIGGTGEFSAEISSQVTGVASDAMYDAVLPILSRPVGTAEEAARRLSDAMDRATKSAVEVIITGWDTTPSPGGPIAVTNTCTVF